MKKTNVILSQDIYQCYFINQKTKGTNVTFVRAENLEVAKDYFINIFKDNFISIKKYERPKIK